jgi:nitrate/nitrite transport system substrate-binding protein
VDGQSLAKLMTTDKREYTFAQTFPTGTHAMWLYYWLAAYGINPMKDAKVITVPPPQMVANMRVGNMDGYCVGEPWGHRAIIDGIGVTAVTTQDIWKDHPEKVLGTTAEFVKKYPNTARAVTAAIIEAGKWIDCRPAEQEQDGRDRGRQELRQHQRGRDQPAHPGPLPERPGQDLGRPQPHEVLQRGHGQLPVSVDGMWFLTQHKRWGLIKDHPDYLGIAKQINQIDLYKEAAAAAKAACPRT